MLHFGEKLGKDTLRGSKHDSFFHEGKDLSHGKGFVERDSYAVRGEEKATLLLMWGWIHKDSHAMHKRRINLTPSPYGWEE